MKTNNPGGCCCPSGFWGLGGEKAWSSATNTVAPVWFTNPGQSPNPTQGFANCLGADYDRECLILATGLGYDATHNSSSYPAVIEFFPAKAGSALAWGEVYLTEAQRNALLAPGPTVTVHRYPTLLGATIQEAINKNLRKFDYLTQSFYGTAGFPGSTGSGMGVWSAPKSGSGVTFHDLPLSSGNNTGVRSVGGPISEADITIDPTTFSYPGYGNSQAVTVFQNDTPLCTMRTNAVLAYSASSAIQAFSMTGGHWLDERLVTPEIRHQLVAYVSLTPVSGSWAGRRRSLFVDGGEEVPFTSILHPSFGWFHGPALGNNYIFIAGAPCGGTSGHGYEDGIPTHYMQLPAGAMGGFFFDYSNKLYYHDGACVRYLAVTRTGLATTPVCYSWKGEEAYALVQGTHPTTGQANWLQFIEISQAPEEGESRVAIPMGGVSGAFGGDNVAVAVPNP